MFGGYEYGEGSLGMVCKFFPYGVTRVETTQEFGSQV